MTQNKANIAVFVSGGGSNLQALIDAVKTDKLSASISLVVSNQQDAYGLKRAEVEGIPTFVFKSNDYPDIKKASDDLLDRLKEKKINYIALAGYLKLLPKIVVKHFKNRIVNIHPALLPRYGGKGMYGHFVHEAVIANKDTESGVTVHLVDEIYDNGRILEQIKVPVFADDTPDTLAARVLKEEHIIYAKVLDKLIKGKYDLNYE